MADSTRPSIVRHANGALDFTDFSGTLWMVSEIARLDYSERLMAMLPHPERRQGWLLFESEHGERRRLAPIPDDWRALTSSALDQCLQQAVTATATEGRRRSDESC
ncbi:MAG TPA: hypothetical protein VGH98_00030 [Gemmatimonadaceae bacterium]|jgi:hypothetical protein